MEYNFRISDVFLYHVTLMNSLFVICFMIES